MILCGELTECSCHAERKCLAQCGCTLEKLNGAQQTQERRLAVTIQETDEIDGKEGFVENPLLTEAQSRVSGQERNGYAANGGKCRIFGSLRISRRWNGC